MLPQHSGRSMDRLLLSDLSGCANVGPASRFWSTVMFLRSVRLANSAATVSGATVGGGGPVVVVVVGAAVWLGVEVKAARVAHATSATTVSEMNAYDSAVPAKLTRAADLREPQVPQNRTGGRKHERENQRQRRQGVDGRAVWRCGRWCEWRRFHRRAGGWDAAERIVAVRVVPVRVLGIGHRWPPCLAFRECSRRRPACRAKVRGSSHIPTVIARGPR